MYLQGYQDVVFIGTYAVAIVMLGALASWKHRNVLAWGLIGGLLFPASLLCLLLEPHLCPTCKASLSKEDRRLRLCSACASPSPGVVPENPIEVQLRARQEPK